MYIRIEAVFHAMCAMLRVQIWKFCICKSILTDLRKGQGHHVSNCRKKINIPLGLHVIERKVNLEILFTPQKSQFNNSAHTIFRVGSLSDFFLFFPIRSYHGWSLGSGSLSCRQGQILISITGKSWIHISTTYTVETRLYPILFFSCDDYGCIEDDVETELLIEFLLIHIFFPSTIYDFFCYFF